MPQQTAEELLDTVKKSLEELVRHARIDVIMNKSTKSRDAHERTRNGKESTGAHRRFGSHGGPTNPLLQNTNKLAHSLMGLGGNAESLGKSFQRVAELFIAGEVIHGIENAIEGQIRAYRSLTDIGQTFGGSMIEMSQQAAAAGLPLDDFAKLMERNSTVAAVMANQSRAGSMSLGMLAKSVRDSTRDVGFYGMSIDEINDMTGQYADTLRQQGRMSELNSRQTSKDVAGFAQDISAFASVTGKSREEIIKATQRALTETSVTSKQLLGQVSKQQNDSLRKATAFFASMPGEAGDMLSKMLTQTFGRGASFLSDEGSEFIEAGAGNLLSTFDSLSEKIKNGGLGDNDSELIAAHDQLKRQYQELLPTLQLQEASGNKQAAHVMEMMNQVVSMSTSQLEQNRANLKASKGFTDFFLTVGDTLNRLSTAFKQGFNAAISPLEDTFKALGNMDDPANGFSKALTDLGTSVGKILVDVLTPDNLKRFEDGVVVIATIAAKAGATLFNLVGSLSDSSDVVRKVNSGTGGIVDDLITTGKWLYNNWSDISSGIDRVTKGFLGLLDYISAPFRALYDVLAPINKGLAGLAAGLAAFATYKVAKNVVGSTLSGLLSTATLKAGVANIYCKTLRGDGGGGGGEGGGGSDGGNLGGEKKAKAKGSASGEGEVEHSKAHPKEAEAAGGKKLAGALEGEAKEAETRVGDVAKKRGLAGRLADGAKSLFKTGASSRLAPFVGDGLQAAGGAGTLVGKGWLRRMLPYADDGVKAAKDAVHSPGLMGSAGRMLGKGAKFLPGVGSALEGANAYTDYQDGDYLGAVGNGLAAGLDLTGIGTPLAKMIDAALMARATIGKDEFDKGALNVAKSIGSGVWNFLRGPALPTAPAPSPAMSPVGAPMHPRLSGDALVAAEKRLRDLTLRNDQSYANPSDDDTDTAEQIQKKIADATDEIALRKDLPDSDQGAQTSQILERIAQLMELMTKLTAAQNGATARYQRNSTRQQSNLLDGMSTMLPF